MSDQMSDPAGRKLVVVLGETELTSEVRAALESLPWSVRYVDDPSALAEGTDAGDLVLTSLASSPVALDATGPASGAATADSGRPVRARSPNPFAPNRLYEEAREYVEETLASVRQSEDPDVDRGRLLAERMHTDLLRDNSLINRSLEPHDTYDLASHCVNVAVLSGKISLGMVSGVEEAVEVIHAGLLHDIGMARLPAEMLRNAGTWSEREQEALRQHPVFGAEILERCAPRNEPLRRAVLQEHERARGQGYPYGLFDRDLDPIARILGVADVFEALSHPRTYRSPFTALQALERVVGMQDEYFAPQVVSALVNEISAFPLDSYVQISSGEIGRVVATDPDNILRPKVELVWDADWKRIQEPAVLDLASRPDLTVARALLDSELPIT
jgi:HD-GYP domain-containing protein (c-di-GMP phosphodiesterase class II)